MKFFNKSSFDNKTVVIAGGASGIGKAMALQLYESGATVIVINRAGTSLEDFRSTIERSRLTIDIKTVDMAQSDEVAALVEQLIAEYGSVDYFINCVGIVQGGELINTPIDHLKSVTETNIGAVLYGTHAIYPHMTTQKSGHIVNFSSSAGLLPTPFMSIYSATKYGIVGFCHALRAEAALHNVKVSVVCPGFVKTPIYDKAYYDAINKQRIIKVLFGKIPIQSPEQAASRALKGIGKNRSTIHTWHSLHAVWIFYRLFPWLYLWINKQLAKRLRKSI